MTVESMQPYVEPVRKAVTVPLDPAAAFDLFTARLATWWPLQAYSLGQARAVTCVLEPRAGGAVYEVRDDGERSIWGHVLVFEPSSRLVMTWHPGQEPATGQEVEVRFLPAEGGGTLVELTHRGWEKLGEKAAEARANYDSPHGWETVLGKHFVEASAA